MCPAMITMARPIAITPTKVDCSTMLAKMPIWKKFGTKTEKAISTTASMNQTRWSSTNSAMARWREDFMEGPCSAMASPSSVTPAKAGVQLWASGRKLDPGLRRDDGDEECWCVTPPA